MSRIVSEVYEDGVSFCYAENEIENMEELRLSKEGGRHKRSQAADITWR